MEFIMKIVWTGKKFNEEKKWEKRMCDVKVNICEGNTPYLGKHFYESAYACPKCDKPLYKTLFSRDKYPINTTDGCLWIERVFTCPVCNMLYSAGDNSSVQLSDGIIYSLELTNDSYNRMLNEMDSLGNY